MRRVMGGIRPTRNLCHVTVTLSQTLSTPACFVAVTRRCCWCPSEGRVNALSLPHCVEKQGKLTVMQPLSWHTFHNSQFFHTSSLLPGLPNKNFPFISKVGDSTATRSHRSHNCIRPQGFGIKKITRVIGLHFCTQMF